MPSPPSCWPCLLHEHEDGSWSITLTATFLLAHHIRGDCGGYAVERLVKKLLRNRPAAFRKRFRYDPEASMFCAYGDDRETLFEVAAVIREATGLTESEFVALSTQGDFDEAAAEKLLLAGFVTGLDPEAQKRFHKTVPAPRRSPFHKQQYDGLKKGSEADRQKAGRKLLSEACTEIRRWHYHLADPRTVDELMTVLQDDPPPKLQREMLLLLRMIAMRHMPDLRMARCFEAALHSAAAQHREIAVGGAARLYRCPWSAIVALVEDRSAKVRAAVAQAATSSIGPFPIWMFSEELERQARFPDDQVDALLSLLTDKTAAVRHAAIKTLCNLGQSDHEDRIRRAVAKEKRAVRKDLEDCFLPRLGA